MQTAYIQTSFFCIVYILRGVKFSVHPLELYSICINWLI